MEDVFARQFFAGFHFGKTNDADHVTLSGQQLVARNGGKLGVEHFDDFVVMIKVDDASAQSMECEEEFAQ